MKEKSTPEKKVKVVLRSSPLALKVVLTVLIVFSIAALAVLWWVHGNLQAQIDGLRTEAAAAEYANSQLEQKTADLGSIQSIQDIAKEELDLVDPKTVFIDPE